MKAIASVIAAVLLADTGACEDSVPPLPLKWETIQQVLDEPSSVTERIIQIYKPSINATKHIQIPETSPHPHTDIEVTLWKSVIPGITIVTTKTNKSIKKKLEGQVRLSYLAVDIDAYTKFQKSSGGTVDGLLTMTPDRARAKFPNAREGNIDSKGTGTITQCLWEHGDDPMAFLCIKFVEGQIKSMEFGQTSKLIQQMLGKKTEQDHKP
jgi:hypothetical protein